MPAFHLADLALSVARRADEDAMSDVRRLYGRPDAPPLPETRRPSRRLHISTRVTRAVATLRGALLPAPRSPGSGTAQREADAT